ncbi:hypothetical protein NQZ68_023880 [Dissostichus eleginoides]|nr:hypothetical protein NQZ68_023880 [Dissostichus eleginoides]
MEKKWFGGPQRLNPLMDKLGLYRTKKRQDSGFAARQGEALELFHQLSQALEVLTDAPAKAAYDKICAAKKQAEERHRKLDDKRKKIKLDLESREQQAEAQTQDEAFNTRTLEEEIARLREEGSRQLEEEQRLIREQIQRERETQQTGSYTISGVVRCSKTNVTPKLKLKWKCKKDDQTNGGYSQDILFRLLQKYGDVSNVIVSSKKKGSAVVEFATVRAAKPLLMGTIGRKNLSRFIVFHTVWILRPFVMMVYFFVVVSSPQHVVSYREHELAAKNESGLSENPLKISWLEGQPEVIAPASQPGLFMSSQFICFGVGEALALHWPEAPGRPLINTPNLGDPRNAESHGNPREADQLHSQSSSLGEDQCFFNLINPNTSVRESGSHCRELGDTDV